MYICMYVCMCMYNVCMYMYVMYVCNQMTDVRRQYMFSQYGTSNTIHAMSSLQSSYCTWNTKRISSQYADLINTIPKDVQNAYLCNSCSVTACAQAI
jgi:hypothetical protein